MQVKNKKNISKIAFCLDANDFHGVDWAVKIHELIKNKQILVISDTFNKVNLKIFKKNNIPFISLNKLNLFNPNNFTAFGNLKRNILKILWLPFCIYQLKKLLDKQKILIHAHSMFYIFLCALAKASFIATPMGSDVLVRPSQSLLYKLCCAWALKKAEIISVDSKELQNKILTLCNKKSVLIQNGISTKEAFFFAKKNLKRNLLISPRAIDENYRIKNILAARNGEKINRPITFFYPYYNLAYINQLQALMIKNDKNIGRITKQHMYFFFARALVVFSIPLSDSSPRSIYEAIFCGAPICTVDAKWVHDLPYCMQSRIIIADIKQSGWMTLAIHKAKKICKIQFKPTPKAIKTYDEICSMKMAIELLYES